MMLLTLQHKWLEDRGRVREYLSKYSRREGEKMRQGEAKILIAHYCSRRSQLHLTEAVSDCMIY